MKHTLAPGERMTVPVLQALLMTQQADGDAMGAAITRRQIERMAERERLRHQALRAGRWPFVVTRDEGTDDEQRDT
jgi:hypothetical protein